MLVEYIPKIELYRNGFFCGSFDSTDAVERYLEEYKLKKNLTDSEMNEAKFSIIETSKHIRFL